MNDVVAEIFGYMILLTAAVLMAWETLAHRRKLDDDAWLRTPTRFRRRMIMAGVLAAVGVLIVAEARHFLVLQHISHLVVYVTALTVLAVTLFVLSIRDLGDMARNAEKFALKNLETALKEQQEKQKADGDNG